MSDTPLPSAQYSNSTINQSGIAFNYGEYFERIADALETIATNSTTIAAKVTEIATNSATLASVVKSVNSDNCTGSGPHIRTLAGECPPGSGDIDMRQLSRAMMMYNMNTSGTIDAVRAEFNNPTPFP